MRNLEDDIASLNARTTPRSQRGGGVLSKRTLSVVAAAIALFLVNWGVEALTGRSILEETREAVGEAVPATAPVPSRPAPRQGSGKASVTPSTDLSKPGGGTISEDDSWKDGLAKKGASTRVETAKAGAAKDASSKRPAAQAQAQAAQRVDFKLFRDGQWVTGVGTVKRVLPDDTQPPRHQRFILSDERGNTVLVAHNIDQAARLKDLKAGDEVAFRGEYRDNDQGGVVHWTHPDSSGRRAGGWLYRR